MHKYTLKRVLSYDHMIFFFGKTSIYEVYCMFFPLIFFPFLKIDTVSFDTE